MQKKRHCYIIKVQFLGFRYSGWQKQPGQKTVEGMIHKTLKFILPNISFKILGAGRTDAKVSALQTAFEIFLEHPLPDMDAFLTDFNRNLPSDIKVLNCTPISSDFNIIQDSKSKEYLYLFSYGQKNHPFCASYLTNCIDELDIDLMIKAAKLYEGTHDFRAYTAKPKANKKLVRTVDSCEILENKILKANFFPKKSYLLKVTGKGFMRYQIRLMMGALMQLGRGELGILDIKTSLEEGNTMQLNYVAPGSGLILHKIDFE
ncbi:tRNA pseudouridine synthase A [Costertonia aggregata]|uniref:tRNA pseudouridine synthase A n=1 Tax=Costertonia aggregata TaxID=343403 RepID=A0A7H9AUC5_9FLAO|nr:tRNA pseudouridine(38-40) synthase TruA [Costertonia aggregata]QLG47036.1 tRNA pseudouridine(38-40) synthase TruA [Costertonia aggregata]